MIKKRQFNLDDVESEIDNARDSAAKGSTFSFGGELRAQIKRKGRNLSISKPLPGAA